MKFVEAAFARNASGFRGAAPPWKAALPCNPSAIGNLVAGSDESDLSDLSDLQSMLEMSIVMSIQVFSEFRRRIEPFPSVPDPSRIRLCRSCEKRAFKFL